MFEATLAKNSLLQPHLVNSQEDPIGSSSPPFPGSGKVWPSENTRGRRGVDHGEPESPHGLIKNVGAPRLLNFRIPEAHVSSNQIRCFNHYIAENGMVILCDTHKEFILS